MAYQKTNKEERNHQFLAFLQAQSDFLEASSYAEESIDQNKKFLIVCEGKNTERFYFERFPVVNKSVITVFGGYGGGKIYLVQEAEKIVAKETYEEHSVSAIPHQNILGDS